MSRSVQEEAGRHGVAELIRPGDFEPERHFYPRVLNATIHPLVAYFMNLSTRQLVDRYCHLNPQTDKDALLEILQYQPKHLRWSGCDLFCVTTAEGKRDMVVVETNSCPSGQKSMPLFEEHKEQGGFQQLIEKSFAPALAKHRFKDGGLAVIYDKNYMGASGYAAAMAAHYDTEVHLVPFFLSDSDPPVRFSEGVLEIRDSEGQWQRIRGAFRYVTQKPWARIPVHTKTFIFNPTLACLAGGRNKMVAAMAYELLNAEIAGSGLELRLPETIRDVRKDEIPLMIRTYGGHAVIKVPYSNAGQGVYTITSQKELDEFMEIDFPYDRFIVQSLIGNYLWSSEGTRGRYYHVGTVPDKQNRIFVADIRMMTISDATGYRPLAVYARRTNHPLSDELDGTVASWDMLGTNLSVKKGADSWESETSRLLLMDRRDFNRLGIGLDDLIKGFIQSVLASVAVDKMACNFLTQKGKFRMKLFRSVNDDEALLSEILI